jgi:hypothetical protein
MIFDYRVRVIHLIMIDLIVSASTVGPSESDISLR